MRPGEVTDVERRCGRVRLLAVLRLMCPDEDGLSGGASTIDPRLEGARRHRLPRGRSRTRRRRARP
ncbi:MAG: hypothetical protein ACYTGB_06075 [Planctomycetota bacterium]